MGIHALFKQPLGYAGLFVGIRTTCERCFPKQMLAAVGVMYQPEARFVLGAGPMLDQVERGFDARAIAHDGVFDLLRTVTAQLLGGDDCAGFPVPLGHQNLTTRAEE